MTEPLLVVEQLEVVYGDVVRAMQGVSIFVDEGSIVALVGLNGAGKTSTLRAISGFLPVEKASITQGTVRFDGRSIRGLTPDQTARLGIAIVPERDKIFTTLTIHENIEVGWRARRETGDSVPKVTLSNIYDLFPLLADKRNRRAILVSGGERQLAAIAAALLSQPRLMLVDEVSMGLSPLIVNMVLSQLNELNQELGLSLLVVDQNVRAALSIAKYGYIMENGLIVHDGTTEELMAHGDVQEFYLGVSGEERQSYRDVKQYRRTRRWWA
ncbi:MAG TPA: ABC transporter ATP-binding protein [Thermohalobaculum sp.]|nr:ABC transporter ATP-binding protein [Thermohalobaculum sp.]